MLQGLPRCKIRISTSNDVKVARVTNVAKVAKSKFLTYRDAKLARVAKVAKSEFLTLKISRLQKLQMLPKLQNPSF